MHLLCCAAQVRAELMHCLCCVEFSIARTPYHHHTLQPHQKHCCVTHPRRRCSHRKPLIDDRRLRSAAQHCSSRNLYIALDWATHSQCRTPHRKALVYRILDNNAGPHIALLRLCNTSSTQDLAMLRNQDLRNSCSAGLTWSCSPSMLNSGRPQLVTLSWSGATRYPQLALSAFLRYLH